MKNFVAKGERVTVTAASAVTSGAGVLVDSMFGVATSDADVGQEVVIMLEGVFDLPKAPSQAWSVGAKVYWDNTNKRCTTDSTNNKLIGVAVKAVGGGASEVVGQVRLNGVAAT